MELFDIITIAAAACLGTSVAAALLAQVVSAIEGQ